MTPPLRQLGPADRAVRIRTWCERWVLWLVRQGADAWEVTQALEGRVAVLEAIQRQPDACEQLRAMAQSAFGDATAEAIACAIGGNGEQ